MDCIKCGALMDQTDKNSFSGRVIREYRCGQCGHSDWEDDGVALWQVLHDSNEKVMESQAMQEANTSGCQPQTARLTPKSLWRRLIDFCRCGFSPRSRKQD